MSVDQWIQWPIEDSTFTAACNPFPCKPTFSSMRVRSFSEECVFASASFGLKMQNSVDRMMQHNVPDPLFDEEVEFGWGEGDEGEDDDVSSPSSELSSPQLSPYQHPRALPCSPSTSFSLDLVPTVMALAPARRTSSVASTVSTASATKAATVTASLPAPTRRTARKPRASQKRKAPPVTTGDESESSDPADGADLNKRDRNKISAAKYRKKRKSARDNLEKQVADLTEEKEKLKAELSRLEVYVRKHSIMIPF